MRRNNIKENFPLKRLTTLGVGGRARYFVTAKSLKELKFALAFAAEKQLPIFVLGGGSNVIIADEGFKGLVIANRLRGRQLKENLKTVTIKVAAGEEWDNFVKWAVRNKLAGLECLSGIPGLVGAVPVQNIAAYGQEAAETIIAVEALDLSSGDVVTFTNQDCQFAYRQSIFNTKAQGKYLITAVVFKLKVNSRPVLRYESLIKSLNKNKRRINLSQTRRAVIKLREKKGMVIRKDQVYSKSVGSFFKNPIISRQDFLLLKDEVLPARQKKRDCCQDPWFWVVTGKRYKVSAACLINLLGYRPGYRQGRVGLSPRHSLAIVNYGGATAKEVISLAKEIQEAVWENFSLKLKPEPDFIGFKDKPL